ncbi:MAG: tetratricopeptide repeat protein [Flavobacteriales bacterium]|nr:tetratricopeptide repeat protein [Flavobacteriales bacterium]
MNLKTVSIKALRLIFVVFLFSSNVSLFAQANKDSLKVINLCKQSDQLFFKDKEGALALCNEAISICNEARDTALLVKPYTSRTLIYFQSGEIDLAINQLDEIIAIGHQFNDAKGLSNAYRRLGQIYQFTSSPEKALESYHESIRYYRKYGSYDGTPTIYADIGDLYSTIGNYELAKENYLKALDLAPHWQNEALTNGIKSQLAQCYSKLEKIDSASILAKEAFISNQEHDLKTNYNAPELVMAEVFIKNNEFKKALAHLLPLYERSKERNDPRQLAFLSKRIGEIHYKLENFKEAKIYFESAFTLNKNLNNKVVYEDAKSLAIVFEQLGNYQQACRYYHLHMDSYAAFLNEESQNQINQWEIKFKTKEIEIKNLALKQEQENARQEQLISDAKIKTQNTIIVAIILGSILLIGMVLLILNRNKIRSENKLILSEQKLLLTQMNPHFIFNSLTAIQGFIYNNETRAAGSYLSNFASLMRLILENSRDELITLEKEILTITKYLELQKVRFENKFEYSIIVADQIKDDDILIPPMFAQPFIENAIEHGFAKLESGGEILVEFTLHDQKIRIEVKDNGIGRLASEAINLETQSEHRSLALEIVNDRLNLLSTKHRQATYLLVEDITDENGQIVGTCAKIELPITREY